MAFRQCYTDRASQAEGAVICQTERAVAHELHLCATGELKATNATKRHHEMVQLRHSAVSRSANAFVRNGKGPQSKHTRFVSSGRHTSEYVSMLTNSTV